MILGFEFSQRTANINDLFTAKVGGDWSIICCKELVGCWGGMGFKIKAWFFEASSRGQSVSKKSMPAITPKSTKRGPPCANPFSPYLLWHISWTESKKPDIFRESPPYIMIDCSFEIEASILGSSMRTGAIQLPGVFIISSYARIECLTARQTFFFPVSCDSTSSMIVTHKSGLSNLFRSM